MAKTTPKVLCILGPTASGKTELALHLARKYNGEIVNVDSAQVYRHMDIGTAKVERAIRAEVPHHLLDIREPFEGYSASDFCADATEKIHTITARGRLPILAGGTMLYFKALFEGLADMPGADQEYRDALERRAEKHGWPALHAELLAIDPDSASRIKPTDSQRIQRALEVFHVSGQTLTSLHATQSSAENGFEFIKIALVPEDRAELHKAIEKRFKQMISKGFLEEVRALVRDNAFVRDAPSMRAVGYRQLLAHLLDGEPLEDAILKGIYATRQLAKRQLTWLRKMPGLQTFDAYAPDIHAKCDSWLENIL